MAGAAIIEALSSLFDETPQDDPWCLKEPLLRRVWSGPARALGLTINERNPWNVRDQTRLNCLCLLAKPVGWTSGGGASGGGGGDKPRKKRSTSSASPGTGASSAANAALLFNELEQGAPMLPHRYAVIAFHLATPEACRALSFTPLRDTRRAYDTAAALGASIGVMQVKLSFRLESCTLCCMLRCRPNARPATSSRELTIALRGDARRRRAVSPLPRLGARRRRAALSPPSPPASACAAWPPPSPLLPKRCARGCA